MKYSESDLLPLSGVQHLVFCERQAALIHVEGSWTDNAFTIDGSLRHKAVHENAPRRERRGDVLIVRGLPLRSFALGLAGFADVVEFHRVRESSAAEKGSNIESVQLPATGGRWKVHPVEYKRGRPKRHRADEVQLCAQAICLEEMLTTEIPAGALFYGRQRRRLTVIFDQGLRGLTTAAAARLHQLVQSGETPPAVKRKRCETCSMEPICLPDALTERPAAHRYLAVAHDQVLKDGGAYEKTSEHPLRHHSGSMAFKGG